VAERNLEEAYALVLEILRRHDLSWVATQVQDQVRAGKPVTRVVAPRQATMLERFAEELPEPRRTRRERLAATEPYSASERLSLALDAVEHAVVETAEIEGEVIQFFGTDSKGAGRVIFRPEEFEEAPGFELRALPRRRLDALAKLRQSVATLRGEIARRGNH